MNRYLKVGNKYLVKIYGTKYDRSFWIDEDDYKKVNKHSWYYQPKWINVRKNDYGSVKAKIDGRLVSLHKLIMGDSPYLNKPQIDHIDTDVCNNCKENLRFVSSKENNLNKKIHKEDKA